MEKIEKILEEIDSLTVIELSELVKGIEEEYNFEESITRVSKVGRELRIEIDFVYNKDSKLKTLDQMDNVREEINDAIKHIDYNKWLNVSFTGNKKWAV